MLNTKLVTWSLAAFTGFSFVLCIVYGLIVPESLHMHQFLENVLPGFKWLSIGSFLLGLIESILWGVYGGLVYSTIYNFFARRFAA